MVIFMFNISAFLFYIFVVTFTPGPNNILSMANASKYGFKKAFEFIAGVFIGFFMIMVLAGYFNLLFFNLIPKIKPFMQILGAGFMLYLAYKIMHTKEDKEKTENQDSQKNEEILIENENKEINLFYPAITLQFVNLKVILYAVTVMSNFIIPYYKSNISLILFSLLLSFVSSLSTTSWALFGSLFNRFLSKYQRQFNIIMGLLLIYSAISASGIMELF